MKLFTTLFLCTAAVGSVAAQDKFGPGFYVTESNDTIRGFIQYKASYVKSFQFRPQMKSASVTLLPERVKAFRITGDRTFQRVTYTVSNGAPETTVFGNVLLDGEMDLLAYERIFLIGSPEKKFFKFVRQRSSDDAQALKNYQANLGAFNILLQDCPSVKEAAQNTGISEDDLVKVVKSYNECRSVPVNDLRPKKGKRLRQFGFSAGASFASLSFRKPDAFYYSSYLYNSNFSTSANPTVGLLALFSGGKPSPILSFQSELVYSQASFNSTFVYVGDLGSGGNVTQTTITDLDYSRLSLAGGLRITGRSAKLHPYIAVGVAVQAFLSIESNVHQTTVINSSVEVEEFELPTSNSSVAAWAAAGIKWDMTGKKALFMDVNYEMSNIADTGIIMALAPRVGFIF